MLQQLRTMGLYEGGKEAAAGGEQAEQEENPQEEEAEERRSSSSRSSSSRSSRRRRSSYKRFSPSSENETLRTVPTCALRTVDSPLTVGRHSRTVRSS